MKLHVGCGNIKKAGYKHQDVVNYTHIDYNSVAWEIDAPNNTFDEIYSRHFFEHLYPWEARDTLKEWCRVLTPEGRVVMIIPNLEFHIKQFNMEGDSERMASKVSNRDHAMAGLYGWCDREHPWMAHKWGYTKESLSELLNKFLQDVTFIDCIESDIHVIAERKL